MEMAPVFVGQVGRQRDRQPDKLVDLMARVGERRRRQHNADGKSACGPKLIGGGPCHLAQQIVPAIKL